MSESPPAPRPHGPGVVSPPGPLDSARRRLLAGSAAALAGLGLRAAQAQPAQPAQPAQTAQTAPTALPAPTGPVVLSIDGRVLRRNAPDRADFDMAMIAALPQRSFEAPTPWYAQARRFTGPLLRDLLHEARATGSTLRLAALNDYRVDMPVEDTQRFGVIVARLLDGQPMAVREKGPLFIVYPFHEVPALRSATYYGRSAWQLRTITVL